MLLDQVLQLPDGVLDPAPQDRADVALEVEPVGVGLDLLDDEAVGGHGRREAEDVHHRLAEREGHVDPGLVHVLDQLRGAGQRHATLAQAAAGPDPDHPLHAFPPSLHVWEIHDLREVTEQVTFG